VCGTTPLDYSQNAINRRTPASGSPCEGTKRKRRTPLEKAEAAAADEEERTRRKKRMKRVLGDEDNRSPVSGTFICSAMEGELLDPRTGEDDGSPVSGTFIF
jgi:hypothetical protein